MPLRPRLAGQLEKNAQPCTLRGRSGCQAGLRRRFTVAEPSRSNGRSVQSVQRAALRRQNVPSISARWSGLPYWREFASAAQLRTVGLVKRVVGRMPAFEHMQCGLTLRSSGRAPAWHLAREAIQVIIRLAGQAPHRCPPLSSNVRPHENDQCPQSSFACSPP